VNGPETVAAIKRFQIRNGLEVTGTLTKETLGSLGLGGGAPALEAPKKGSAPQPLPPPSAPRDGPARPNSPIDLRRNETVQDTDREFLRKQQPPNSRGVDDEDAQRTPAAGGGGEYSRIFARTPYAVAPLEVQQSTLRKAQRFLAEQGHFRDAAADGNPGPDTEEAILGYQRSVRLPLTGRLDMQTLSAMRLLPGAKGAPPMRAPGGVRPGNRGPSKVYRGVWVE
jgi:peptidoglycan hydrolase-like protein with peptidoglycan-binding domain